MTTMRIAICDDEQVQRELLGKYIRQWGSLRERKVEITDFENSEEFLFHREDDRAYDLLVMDIEMGDMNGMELVKKLRAEQDNVAVLFVTGYDQYMAQGYEVEALHYLLKPVQKEKLFSVFDRAVARSTPEKKHFFRTQTGAVSLPLSAVWYAQARGHNCILYTDKQEYVLMYGISSLQKELEAEKEFISSHRSYLVNLKHVSAVEQLEIVMDDGTRLPVSRGNVKEVNQAFIQYYL